MELDENNNLRTSLLLVQLVKKEREKRSGENDFNFYDFFIGSHDHAVSSLQASLHFFLSFGKKSVSTFLDPLVT